MYGREYKGKVLRFEPSGGLMHASLVMQDKESDSYWSIMTGEALAGEFKGTHLEELPVGEKTQWKDWVRQHPDTLVLSVDGEEHEENNPYDNYFASAEGFRGGRAQDDRLSTKEPIYAFQLGGKAYAVPFAAFEGGAAFTVGGRQVFLYRPAGAAIFHSSVAFLGEGFERRGEAWEGPGGASFDGEAFNGGAGGVVEPLEGFDTFWFNWSETHPETAVLGSGEGAGP